MQNIPEEKFRPAAPQQAAEALAQAAPAGYFTDALRRFRKNRSSVAAAFILLLLFLFALLGPLASPYTVSNRDGYYKWMPPKCAPLAFLGWDGCRELTLNQASYDYYRAIGAEYGGSCIKSAQEKDGSYTVRVDAYEAVGFLYMDLSKAEYQALLAYQQETGRQLLYPIPNNHKTTYLSVASGANLWYKLADSGPGSAGLAAAHDESGAPILEADYLLDADGQPVYALRNQTGCRCRVLYSEYYRYQNGFAAAYLFGTNQHGQDIFVCLASGARLSFLLALSVSLINFVIGIGYGAIEGYYGGTADLVLERVADILASVPFIVVATLFQLHLAQKAGPVLSLLFAFVLTGWIGIASRVRTQFYRFKNAEYVLAARTLGAGDARLIFRHILPNCLVTVITGTVLIIPGVIFSESMLSYLGIVNLETTGLSSIGTMLANGRQYLNSHPHIIAFPGVFLALLEISFNLFGSGLRDALNPSLKGAE